VNKRKPKFHVRAADHKPHDAAPAAHA
jgi:hypothetical protein